jgi:gamma-glutamylcyclotransferase (GGCT)/AIG2-like uncharacterized protein YtfP
MRERCPAAIPLHTFILDDWKLVFSGVASIVPRSGDFVPGVLWYITKECEESLDVFEGYPHYYHKVVLRIDDREVMFYRKNNEELQDPHNAYLQVIREGYSDWQLDPIYLQQALLDTTMQCIAGNQ